MREFVVDMAWGVIAADLGVSMQDVLRRARLPLDLTAQETPSVTVEEFNRLIDVFADATGAGDEAPLVVAEKITVESFTPPIFAALCSRNLNVAVERLSLYKPLVGPMTLSLEQDDLRTTVRPGAAPDGQAISPLMLATELALLTRIARLGTRERIAPAAVSIPFRVGPAYATFFGVAPTLGPAAVSFHAQDAEKPFLTASDRLWSAFEPDLRLRLADLRQGAGFTDRVRARLTEGMAGGVSTIEDVARDLAVSPRTLQRRLREEGSSFQEVLNDLRRDLAQHYIENSSISGAEISFLLGYKEPGSFYRAYQGWTGLTPHAARAERRVS